MRLVIFSEENIANKLFTLEEIEKLVAWNSPLVPVWIHISFNRKEKDIIIFDFETGHPPLRAIIYDKDKSQKANMFFLNKNALKEK